MLVAGCMAGSPVLDRARELYQHAEYAEVIRALLPVTGKDAPDYALLGQAYYMQGDFKKASENLEQAVNRAPGNSVYHNWLGRAFGRRAETSSFLTAPRLATKTREAFEKAVALDPRNLEALSDLFDYYLDAPGFLGGGLDKAAALSQRLGELAPGEYHYTQAKLAEKRKEFQTAEQQFRRAIDVAPRQVGRFIDLAKFLAKQQRYRESEDAFRLAEQVAPNSPKLMFARASTYIRTGRNLIEARNLLKRYIGSPLTPEDPPRRDAEALLKQASGS